MAPPTPPPPPPTHTYIHMFLSFFLSSSLSLSQLMLLIGEQFEEASEEICGAVVNVRPRGDKLAIWTGHSERKERVLKIGYI